MAGDDQKLRVFISYSRKDVLFADQLVLALERFGYEPIIDRHDIGEGEKWKPRLHNLIIRADVVVFVLTEKSAGSPVCAWEVEEALSLGKRIIPVLPEPLSPNAQPPKALADRNYILFFSAQSVPGSGFFAGVEALCRALDVDVEWVRSLTRLTERATEWDAAARPDDRLPRGTDLEEAQSWLQETPLGAEVPQLVRDFLTEAADAEQRREAEAKSQIAEREAALAEQAKLSVRIRRISIVALSIGAAMVLGFAYLTVLAQSESRKARNAVARTLLERSWSVPISESALASKYAVAGLLFSADGSNDALARAALARSVNSGIDESALLQAPEQIDQLLRIRGTDNAVTISRAGIATLWIAEGGSAMRAVPLRHEARVLSAGISPDGRQVITASFDSTLKIWNSETGVPISTLVGHEGGLTAASFSPDGSRLVTSSFDRTARLWDVRTGKGISMLTGHSGYVTTVNFSPDGARVLTASWDNTARIWDAATGAPIAAPLVHRDSVSVAEFSPDASQILTASRDGTATLWDANTGAALVALRGVGEIIRVANFSLDGSVIRTLDWAGRYVSYSAETGQPLIAIDGRRGEISDAQFSDYGGILAAIDGDVLLVWEIETAKLIGEIETDEPDMGLLEVHQESVTLSKASGEVITLDLAAHLAELQQLRVKACQMLVDGDADFSNYERALDPFIGSELQLGQLPEFCLVETSAL